MARVVATGPAPNPLLGIGRGIEQFFKNRGENKRRGEALDANAALTEAIVNPFADLLNRRTLGLSEDLEEEAPVTDPLELIKRNIAQMNPEERRGLPQETLQKIFLTGIGKQKEGTEILTPAEVKAAGFRKGTTVQKGPGGLKVLQGPEKGGAKGPPAPRPVPFAFKKGQTVPENLRSLFPELSVDLKTGIALKDLRGREIREFDAEANKFTPRRIVADVPSKPDKTEKFREFLPDQIKRAAIIDVLKASGRPDALSLVLAGGEIGNLSALGLKPEDIQVRELELIEAQLRGSALTENARRKANVFVAQEVAERTENAKVLILELQAKGGALDKIESSIGATKFVDQAAIKRFIAQLRLRVEAEQAAQELDLKQKAAELERQAKLQNPAAGFQLPDNPQGPLGVISANPLFQR